MTKALKKFVRRAAMTFTRLCRICGGSRDRACSMRNSTLIFIRILLRLEGATYLLEVAKKHSSEITWKWKMIISRKSQFSTNICSSNSAKSRLYQVLILWAPRNNLSNVAMVASIRNLLKRWQCLKVTVDLAQPKQ